MGWCDCGEDSIGRPIGYGFPAVCDDKFCVKEIHRGLSYACGDMHGETEWGCEKYFCEKHRQNFIKSNEGELISVCTECYNEILKQLTEHPEDGLIYDNEEGLIIEK